MDSQQETIDRLCWDLSSLLRIFRSQLAKCVQLQVVASRMAWKSQPQRQEDWIDRDRDTSQGASPHRPCQPRAAGMRPGIQREDLGLWAFCLGPRPRELGQRRLDKS